MRFPFILAVAQARRALALSAVVTGCVLAVGAAQAQTQPARPPAGAPPAARPPAGAKPPAAAPAPAPQAPAPDQAQAAPPELPPIVYSPWTKFCGKDQQQQNAKEVCLTVKEARLETGQFIAGAALIEQEGEQKKILRVTLPLGMQLPQGTRLIVDKNEPQLGKYVVCLPNGCMADFDVNAEFVGKLKKGTTLLLQGINLPGQAASYPLPLGEFQKANEGPPTDPKVFEEQQRKLQEELQKKAEQARQKLQGQAGQAGQPAPAR
jgi:invasion protein IalB